ncbi:MAG: hypothetical protein AB8F74_03060, partial [Saprospiraceae bacterium]
MRNLLTLLFIALLFSTTVNAEQNSIDQLLKQVGTQQGAEKAATLNALSAASLLAENRVAAADYAQQAMDLAKDVNYKEQEAMAFDNMALVYQNKNDFT